MTISILGCGWLGLPLGEALVRQGFWVRGSTTNPDKLARLTRAGIEPHLLTLNPQPVGNLAALLNSDILLIDIPPRAGVTGSAHHPAQIRAVAGAVRQSAVQRVIYVSSTSVYSEKNRVMAEADVTTPDTSAAPALVAAEQEILTLTPDRQTTVLRCGGLMGYDRMPGKYVSGRIVDTGAVPVNYLHRDDAIGLIMSVIVQHLTGVFNLVAPQHPTREAVYRQNCAAFGWPLPVFAEPTAPVPYKTVSPAKVLAATGYEFLFPDPLAFFYSPPGPDK
jgi:nucleoside-diphosphate-sugar epimerase